MAEDPTVKVRAGAAQVFLAKAKEFARLMDRALEDGELNGAASTASHCVISAADALLAHEKGVRSSSKDHAVVVRLIARIAAPGAREKAAQIEGVLALTHVAEYEGRHITPKEAAQAVLKARRFLAWVEAQLEG